MVTEAVSPSAKKSKSLPGLKVMLFSLCETEAELIVTAAPLDVLAEAIEAEPLWRLRLSGVSGSVSLAMTSTVTAEFSVVEPVSATAEGASLVPVTVMERVPLSVRGVPSSSVSVTV